MKDIKDNFSAQSDIYASFRPGYPAELFAWIYSHCRHFDSAWDCATGNGQAAINLSPKFKIVYATDLSISQLKNAHQSGNIIYSVENAEQPSFNEDTFDLVTVAQALHWFDHKMFFEQLYKVVKPGALFAAWGYDLLRVNDEIDTIIREFYSGTIGPYWDEERKHVDNHYNTIAFPFELLPCPKFSISYSWAAEHMIGYLNTWSAVQHYIKKNNSNPVELIKEKLLSVWGNEERMVTFPIFMKAGYPTPNADIDRQKNNAL